MFVGNVYKDVEGEAKVLGRRSCFGCGVKAEQAGEGRYDWEVED